MTTRECRISFNWKIGEELSSKVTNLEKREERSIYEGREKENE